MTIIALFLVGLLVGARLGVYSLALLEIVLFLVAALGGWRLGIETTMLRIGVAILAPSAGFVSAIIASYFLRPPVGQSRKDLDAFRRRGNRDLLRSSRPH